MGEETTISQYFCQYTREQLNNLISYRDGETRLGQHVAVAGADIRQALQSDAVKYVLLGIPEDIGVRANYGVGGAHTLWNPALKALLNIQSTTALPGNELLVLGAFDFSEWMNESLQADPVALRAYVARIDDEVYPLIRMIVAAGKIPVVIGGGHNNAYPLLKGASLALGQPVNCINLDAHSDFRVLEGRHSGNGFRYAKEEGYLSHYAIVGLHRNYNSQPVLNDIAGDLTLQASFYEDIFLDEQLGFRDALANAVGHTDNRPTGIELDMDCIERVLSSAATPNGITTVQARQYLRYCATNSQPAYLHITEGAVQLRDGRSDNSTAKLAAYLVSDFMRK